MASTKLSDIVLERDGYYVTRVAKGFEIYRNGATAAERVSSIGFTGQAGLDRVNAEIDRRLELRAWRW